jgi:glyoxylase-like metal-dependent hydrolase (beta-lactamase superfamily II)
MTTDIFSWQIGDVKITKVLEMEQHWPGLALLPNATKEAVLAHDWVVGPFATDTGRFKLSFHAYCLEVGDQKIVVDTCTGNDKPRPEFNGLHMLKTDFLEKMTEAGFGPDDVDLVICTHLHVDHVGWNTHLVEDAWVPTFPRARYLFGDREWAHWSVEPQVYGDVVGDSVRPVIDAGLAELVASDLRVNDAVWLEPTPGHTPGHHSVHIASGGMDAIISGDMIHHPIQVEEIDWWSTADSDANAAIACRRAFLEKYCDDHTLILGTHWAGPSGGKIVRHGQSFRIGLD